jgi:hypothetical protein
MFLHDSILVLEKLINSDHRVRLEQLPGGFLDCVIREPGYLRCLFEMEFTLQEVLPRLANITSGFVRALNQQEKITVVPFAAKFVKAFGPYVASLQ